MAPRKRADQCKFGSWSTTPNKHLQYFSFLFFIFLLRVQAKPRHEPTQPAHTKSCSIRKIEATNDRADNEPTHYSLMFRFSLLPLTKGRKGCNRFTGSETGGARRTRAREGGWKGENEPRSRSEHPHKLQQTTPGVGREGANPGVPAMAAKYRNTTLRLSNVGVRNRSRHSIVGSTVATFVLFFSNFGIENRTRSRRQT